MHEIRKVETPVVRAPPSFLPRSLTDVSDKNPGERLFHVAHWKGGNTFFMGGESGHLYIFDENAGSVEVKQHLTGDSSIEKLLVSETKDELMLFSGSGDIVIINVADFSIKKKVSAAHCRGIFSASLDEENAQLITGSLDSTIKIWDSSDYTTIGEFYSRNHGFLSIRSKKIGPHNLVIAGAVDGKMHLFNEEKSAIPWNMKIHDGPVFSIMEVPCSDLLLTAGGDGFVNLVDSERQQILQRVPASQGKVLDLAFLETQHLPDTFQFVSAGGDGSLGLWEFDLLTGTISFLAKLEGHSRTMEKIIVDDAKSRLVTVSSDSTLIEWNM